MCRQKQYRQTALQEAGFRLSCFMYCSLLFSIGHVVFRVIMLLFCYVVPLENVVPLLF